MLVAVASVTSLWHDRFVRRSPTLPRGPNYSGWSTIPADSSITLPFFRGGPACPIFGHLNLWLGAVYSVAWTCWSCGHIVSPFLLVNQARYFPAILPLIHWWGPLHTTSDRRFGGSPTSQCLDCNAPQKHSSTWMYIVLKKCHTWKNLSGWWFGFFIFSYIRKNNPNLLTFFRGVETTNQIFK